MREILGLGIFLIAFSSQAAVLNCVQTKGWKTEGMWVTSNVSGEYEVISDKQAKFSEVSFNYRIFWDASLAEDSVWSKGEQTFTDLTNSLSYSPRKYKDHIRFSAYVNGMASGSGYGDLGLIVPAKEILAAESADFTGYLMMTWMDDHYGGTVKLNCSLN